jgi:hypothetical protein
VIDTGVGPELGSVSM